MSTTDGERDDDGSVDVEAAWADIVARGEVESPRTGPWPALEDAPDVDPEVEPDQQPDPPAGTAEPAWSSPVSHVGGEVVRTAGERDEVDADDEEGGYVPPEPPPLPRGDTVSRLAWGGVLGAPVFFVLTMLFWRSVPTLLVVLAVAAFVAGFVTLVVRMPDRDDDSWDDGAVV